MSNNEIYCKNHDYKQQCFLQEQQYENKKKISTCKMYLNAMQRNSQKVPVVGFRSGITTVKQMLEEQYTILNFAQFNHLIVKFINEIQSQNLEQQSTIAIFSQNSPAWLAADLAISFTNNVVAPIYNTLSLQQTIYCLNLVKAQLLFISEQYQKYVPVLMEQVQTLKNVFVMKDKYQQNTQEVKNKIIYDAAQLYCQYIDVGEVYETEVCSMYSIASTISNATNSKQENINNQIDQKQVEEIRQKVETSINNIIQIELDIQEILSVDEQTQQQELKQLQQLTETVKYDSFNSIIFTSGTSGSNPKGAAHSHFTFLSQISDLTYRFVQRVEEQNIQQYNEQGVYRHISFLPLAHIFERGFEYVCLRNGITIYYGCGNLKLLMQDLKLIKPTIMLGVPRIFQKVYNEFQKKFQKLPKYQQKVFNILFSIRIHEIRNYQKKGKTYYHNYGRFKKSLYKKIFGQIKDLFGGQLEMIVIGSSALPGYLREFIEVTTDAQITIGYGMSECVAVSMNYIGQYYNDDLQLGFICKGTTAKLIDRSDSCEFSLQNDKIGEMCIKSDGQCLGYIDAEKQYPNLISNKDEQGYYHTNDLCKLNQDGSASFLRRVNMITKLAQGEFVDIEMIETIIETIPSITCAIVYGDIKMNNPVAIVSCDKSAINSIKLDENTTLEQYILKQIDQQIRIKGLKGYNIPKQVKIYIGEEDKWIANTELFTASQKKRHGQMYKYFKNDIDQLKQKCQE